MAVSSRCDNDDPCDSFTMLIVLPQVQRRFDFEDSSRFLRWSEDSKMILFLGFLTTFLAFLIARRSTGFDGFLFSSASFTPASTSILAKQLVKGCHSAAFACDEDLLVAGSCTDGSSEVVSGLSTSIVVCSRSGLGMEAISRSLADRRSIRASDAGPNTFARKLLRLRLVDDDLELFAIFAGLNRRCLCPF